MTVVTKLKKSEKYVDFNKRPLKILGYLRVAVEVGRRAINEARVLVVEDGAKPIVGRDWLIALQYKIAQPMTEGECSEFDNIVVNNVFIVNTKL